MLKQIRQSLRLGPAVTLYEQPRRWLVTLYRVSSWQLYPVSIPLQSTTNFKSLLLPLLFFAITQVHMFVFNYLIISMYFYTFVTCVFEKI